MASSLRARRFTSMVTPVPPLETRPSPTSACSERAVKTHDAIAAAGKFGVSILAADQGEISTRFASRSDDKFAGIPVDRGALGVPLIRGALTTLECKVREQLPGGDHSIFVGEVVDARTAGGTPLLYFRSGYREMRA